MFAFKSVNNRSLCSVQYPTVLVITTYNHILSIATNTKSAAKYMLLVSPVTLKIGSTFWAVNNERISINTWTTRQNGCHFAEDIIEIIFLNEMCHIAFEISFTFVRKGLIDDNPALVQGNGLASNKWQATIWTNGGLFYWRIYGHDEFIINCIQISFKKHQKSNVFRISVRPSVKTIFHKIVPSHFTSDQPNTISWWISVGI